MNNVKFSVVVPVYNEEESILPLCSSLKRVMSNLKEEYEVIINDSSQDQSLKVLTSVDFKPADFIIVDIKDRSGQSCALQSGFDIARGEIIITMDGDLQNDPNDIPKLLDKIKEDYDIVCGWRYHRKDPWDKIFISKIANYFRRVIAKEKIHDVGCTLRVFKKEALKDVYLSWCMHRFFTLIMSRLGYKITEVNVIHCHRRFGRSKYNLHNRLFEGLAGLCYFLFCDIHRVVTKKANYKIKEVIRK